MFGARISLSVALVSVALVSVAMSLVIGTTFGLVSGLMITFTVSSLNFIGDALRDALDPHALID